LLLYLVVHRAQVQKHFEAPQVTHKPLELVQTQSQVT
jgi:hypothetical protein